MQKITPFLWFEKDGKKVAEYYVSVFTKGPYSSENDAKIKDMQTMTDTPSGTVEVVMLELFGNDFTLMSAGPEFKFNESVSFVIDCKDQEEVDYFWNTLTSDGGQESVCGWLKDKYGLSWQVVPRRLNELQSDPDKEKAGRVTQAMLKMKKIIIEDLEKAYNEE